MNVFSVIKPAQCRCPVAVPSKTCVCCRSLAGFPGSNPTGGGGNVYLSVVSVVCCQVEVSASGRSFVQGVGVLMQWRNFVDEA